MRSLIAIIILVIMCATTCDSAIGTYSMWLSCYPQAIVADSHSAATISAEVRSSTGGPAPDGTVVEFTTSLGIIERQARTTAGVARVRLESGSTTGTALVSAVASDGGAVAQLRVDFLEPGTEMFDESFISVASDKHLGYDVDAGIVDSAGGVTIYHRGLTVTAEVAQINARTNLLTARARMGGDPITIRRGKKTIYASALSYNFTSMNGVLLGSVDEGAKRMLFRGRDLFVEPDTDPKDDVSFDIVPVTESKLFIRAKSLVIRPGEVIKFRRANYYMEGEKVLSYPLQVVPLRGGMDSALGGTGQMLTYGTEGLRLSLPFYYSLTPNGTGAVRLKHSEQTGWGSYSERSGWQVDVDQEYNIAGSTQGTFSLNRVTSRDWGIRWNQRNEFDNDSRLYTYFDFPGHRDLYGTVDYSQSLRNHTWAVSLRGNRLKVGDGRYSANTYLQSRAKPLFNKALSYAYTTRLSYNSILSGDYSKTGTGLGLQFYGKPLRFGASNVSSSLTVSQDWGGSNDGRSVFANVGLFRMLGNKGMLNLNYSYAWGDQALGFSSQRLSANLSLRPSTKWGASVYTVYGLDDGSLSAFGDLSYQFMPTWRVNWLGTLQKFAYGDLSDWELALCRILGRQEARLTWSQSRKRFRLEFSAAQF